MRGTDGWRRGTPTSDSDDSEEREALHALLYRPAVARIPDQRPIVSISSRASVRAENDCCPVTRLPSRTA